MHVFKSVCAQLLVSLAALVAILAAMTPAASAARWRTDGGGFVGVWTAVSISGGSSTITCELLLSGEFHATTFTKTQRALVALITAATIGSCQGDGRATILRETLPWAELYDSFQGRLPNITAFRTDITGMGVQVSDGIPCLLDVDDPEPLQYARAISGGAVTGVSFDQTATIGLSGGFLCELAGDASFSGSGTMRRAGGGSMSFILV